MVRNADSALRDRQVGRMSVRSKNVWGLVGSLSMLVGGPLPGHAKTGPVGAALSPDGKRLYVTNIGLDAITVVDTVTQQVTARVKAPPHTYTAPMGVAVSPDGTRLYVARDPDAQPMIRHGVLLVIDTTTNQVVTTVEVGANPVGVAVSPDGSRVFVSNYYGGGTVSVIDAANNQVIATVTVGRYPGSLVVSPDGSRLYVSIAPAPNGTAPPVGWHDGGHRDGYQSGDRRGESRSLPWKAGR
jgi:YVTN family beta-propeller protein